MHLVPRKWMMMVRMPASHDIILSIIQTLEMAQVFCSNINLYPFLYGQMTLLYMEVLPHIGYCLQWLEQPVLITVKLLMALRHTVA